MRKSFQVLIPTLLVCIATVGASAQSFRVQCPTSTITHPPVPITSATASGSTVTIASGLVPSVGDTISVAGVTPAGYNGRFTVATVGSGTSAGTFTYTDTSAGLGVSGKGGTVIDNNSEPAYNGPTTFTTNAQGFVTPNPGTANGAIKCQQISGGDGFMTEADGTQTFMFSFGPLSGLADIAAGQPGTQFPSVFNAPWTGCSDAANCTTPLVRGDPATSDLATSGASPGTALPESAAGFQWNGAVGLTPEVVQTLNISDLVEGHVALPGTTGTCPNPPVAGSSTSTVVTAYTYEPLNLPAGTQVIIASNPANGIPAGYQGPVTVTCVAQVNPGAPAGTPGFVQAPSGFAQYAFQYTAPTAATGLAVQSLLGGVTASTQPQLDGHVDPRQIMDIGPLNGNIPAPLIAFDEDDEFFLTLTNVGMIMRPDLFEQHTVHFHGYPNASSFFDGVPDASIAINIGASFTYYYLAPDAGTYFWHCHITPPEHLQMGMVGQLYVRPRQDRVPSGKSLYTYLGYQNGIGLPSGVKADLRTACNPGSDILCSATMPATANTVAQGTDKLGNNQKYVYNDGDGSTAYDVEYPLQMHGFDPNFHFVGMTFNPEMFVDMKDKYFLLNGRSYPDTIAAGPQATVTSDGQVHYSQPLPAIINIPVGGRAALRLVNLSVSEYHTLASLGIPMKVVGWNAKLLRDQAGLNTEYYTNSITLGGGESLDVILDASDASCGSTGCAAKLYPAKSVFYLFTPQLDHLSNDAENFGGLMTEVHICTSVTGPAPTPATQYPIDPGSTFGNTCNN